MSQHTISVTVNDSAETITVDSRTLLVHTLRETLDLTGVKVGCESGKCGACTVQLDGKAVKSCTLLSVQADGCELTTIESDDGRFEPIRDSFHEEHGLQCGYCTPGMIVATDALLRETEDPDEAMIRDALKGNICRCTGYDNIVEAIKTAGDRLTASGDGG